MGRSSRGWRTRLRRRHWRRRGAEWMQARRQGPLTCVKRGRRRTGVCRTRQLSSPPARWSVPPPPCPSKRPPAPFALQPPPRRSQLRPAPLALRPPSRAADEAAAGALPVADVAPMGAAPAGDGARRRGRRGRGAVPGHRRWSGRSEAMLLRWLRRPRRRRRGGVRARRKPPHRQRPLRCGASSSTRWRSSSAVPTSRGGLGTRCCATCSLRCRWRPSA